MESPFAAPRPSSAWAEGPRTAQPACAEAAGVRAVAWAGRRLPRRSPRPVRARRSYGSAQPERHLSERAVQLSRARARPEWPPSRGRRRRTGAASAIRGSERDAWLQRVRGGEDPYSPVSPAPKLPSVPCSSPISRLSHSDGRNRGTQKNDPFDDPSRMGHDTPHQRRSCTSAAGSSTRCDHVSQLSPGRLSKTNSRSNRSQGR